MADLIITATLDAKDVEAKAKQIQTNLKNVGTGQANQAGKALANNMQSAKLASDAMFRTFTSMGGVIGSIASKLQGFTEAARMLKQASALKGASGASGAGNGLLSSAANVASNLGGGAIEER